MNRRIRFAHIKRGLYTFFLCLGAACLIGCSDAPSSTTPDASTDAGADAATDLPPGLVCEPHDTRRCDCAVGVGEQNCSGDGSEWEVCLCPIKSLDLLDTTIVVTPAATGTAHVAGRTLRMPQAGNARWASLQAGDVIVWMEGAGLMGRVTGVFLEGDEIAVDTEPLHPNEVYSSIEIELDETELNLEGYVSDAVRALNEEDALLGGVSGFTIDNGGLSVRPMGSLELDEFGFERGSRFTFTPTVSTNVKLSWVPEPDIAEFDFTAGLDTTLVLKPVIGIKGVGSVSLEAELIQLAARAAGKPITEPLEVPLGGGLSAEVTVNLRCIVAADGDATFRKELQLGLDASGSVSKRRDRDPEWQTSGSATTTSSSSATSIEWDASASLKCELKPRFRLRFLKVAYGYAEAGPYIKANQEFFQRYAFTVTAGVEGTAGVGVEIEVPEGPTFTLFERTFELFDFDTQLYERQFSVCGDGYRQKDSQKVGGDPIEIFSREDCDSGDITDPTGGCNDDCECTGTFVASDEPDTLNGEEYPELWVFGSAYNWCTNLCGNGVVDENEVCDDGLTFDVCGRCSKTCDRIVGTCGDGIADSLACGGRDACDDQNTENCDGCTNDCQLSYEVCGDGITSFLCGEACDDGNTVDGDECSADCKVSNVGFCGDGVVNFQQDGTFDECDEGNNWYCNGCAPGCTAFTNTCGDGVLCGTECEPTTPGQDDLHCNADCTPASCGDGYVNAIAGEVCDGESATCDDDCTVAECGDGVLNTLAGEECDDGRETWRCNADCTLSACGDGVVNATRGEACDDGDTDDCTTACNSVCTGPTFQGTCGDGVVASACGVEVCDDGFRNGTCGFCSSDCQTASTTTCGDGVREGCEVCDDGNTVSGDGLCRGDCAKEEICGDGFIDDGEVCDDGLQNGTCGFCSSDCQTASTTTCGDGVREGCEVCEDSDPTNTSIDTGCSAAAPNCNGCSGCSTDVCGDHIVGPSEVCDPLGSCSNPDDATCTIDDTSACADPSEPCFFNEFECAGSCTRVVTCGDGFQDGVEQCDNGVDNGPSPKICSTSCTFNP